MLEAHDQIAVNTLFLLFLITGFGLWVIRKHYDNAWKIEQLEIKVKRGGKILNEDENAIIKDLKQMQTDIIRIRQDCVNIDSKYRIKDEWATSRIEQLVNIVQQHMSVQDVIDSFEDRKITMDEASEMESDDV
tara:strand:+ start:950 stop:1348 length:399 start_codon:yes stop_codon:yes gene_type:complete